MQSDASLHQTYSNVAERAEPARAELEGAGSPFEGDLSRLSELDLGQPGELDLNLDALPEAFEATFGPVARMAERALEEALGPATPISDTTAFPFRAVASLFIVDGFGERFRATAYFVSPRTLVTSGHNVFFKGRWAQSITVMPGRNGNFLPFGQLTSTRFNSVRGWVEGTDPDYDYGAILLDRPLGDAVGWFGLRQLSDAELMGNVCELSGYPDSFGNQVGGRGQIANVNPLRIFYDIPTAIGQSGSPVSREGDPHTIAVHGYYSNGLRSGIRINSVVHQTIRSWMT